MEIREIKLKYGKRKKAPATIRTAADAYPVFKAFQPDNVQEHFCALYLDSSHAPIGWRVCTTGLANSSQIHPREVFQSAVILGATAMLICHNHPSGELTPSREDIEVTQRLNKAGEVLGIKILDHLILSDSGFISMREQGIGGF